MKGRKVHFKNGRLGSALTIKIIPDSRKNQLTSILDDGTLVIKLRTTDTGQKTNTELIKFLAEILDLIDSELEIIAGEEGTDKLVAVFDVESDELERRIMDYWL